MNKKIRRMIREIKRRGGLVHVNGALPDAVAEQFLQEVLNCPDCCAATHAADDARLFEEGGIDRRLAGGSPPRSTNGH
jgi:hypothetical protein